MTTLKQISVGSSCRIVRLHGKGPVFRRLLEMGLVPETPLKVLRRAPFGDPLEVELHGYHLALRLAEADLVEVASP